MTAAESILAKLDESTKRSEAATPGEWKTWGMEVMSDVDGSSNVDHCVPVADTCCIRDGRPRTFDADFIAAARTDLPRRDDALRVAVKDIDAAIQQLGNERSEVPRMIIADRLVYALQKIAEILEGR